MKLIKRLEDNNYLVDANNNVWTSDVEQARKYKIGEAIIAKVRLYSQGVQFNEIEEIEFIPTTTTTTIINP